MPSSNDVATVVEDRWGVTVSVEGRLVVICYHCTPTLGTAELVAAAVDQILADPTRRFGLLAIVDTRWPAADAATRKAIARLMKQHEGNIVALAQVPLGRGFAAAAIRAVFAGINMLARAAYPVEVFAECAPALQWLAARGVVAPGRVPALAAEVLAVLDRSAAA